MATKTELLKSILTASGVDPDALPDNLESTLLKAIAENCGAYDWNASEGEPGYIANRTHYSEIADTVLIDNQTYGDEEAVVLDFALVAGQSYHIVWNGSEYDEVARNAETGGVSVVMLGNSSIVGGENTGEPYAILCMDGMGTLLCDMSGAESATVTLSTEQEVVQKLPEKYLPETAPFYFDIVANTSGGISFISTVLVAKLEEALASGRMIIAKFSIYGIPQTDLLHLVTYAEDESNPYGKLLLFSGNVYKVKLTPQEDGLYVVEGI